MNMKKTILLCILSISVFSCSSDDGGSKSNDYVTDVESLMSKITIEGAVLKNGNIPVPEGVLGDNINSIPNTVIVTSNSLFSIPIKTDNSEGRIPRIVFIKLEGSSKYYQIDLDDNGNPVGSNRSISAEHRVRLSCNGSSNIGLPANGADTSSPYINAAEVYTYSPPLQSQVGDLSFLQNRNYWSTKRIINFKVLDVGTGDVQISMTWDTQSDVDLWLTEPNGNKIYYANKISSTGGELDFDNTSEYGPENIFYKTVAPSGTYKVEVDYFSGAPLVTNYNIVVKKGNSITSYEGTLTVDNQTNTVVEFTK
jgi:hypothetical protein